VNETSYPIVTPQTDCWAQLTFTYTAFIFGKFG